MVAVDIFNIFRLKQSRRLGIKAFDLFNRIVKWRWFKTEGEDIAWYKSIKPFQAPTAGAWEVPVQRVMEEIDKIRCKKLLKK